MATSELHENQKDNLSIYPNPVQDQLFIKSDETILKAEIFDSTGRIVISSGIIENFLNVSQLAKGSYLIKIYTKENISIKKIIKN